MKKLLLIPASLFFLASCSSTGKDTSQAESLKSRPQQAAETVSNHPTTDAFFTALQRADYPAASQTFDAKVKAALGDNLEKVWIQKTKDLGTLQKWRTIDKLKKDKYEIQAVILDFEKGTLRMTITVAMDTREIAGFFFAQESAAGSSTSESRFAADQLEKVRIGKEPYLLDGVILFPKGEGPFPGVVLVHGSGPLDMDAKVAANAPFRDIAEGLASRGIAVLRYNKRFFQYPENSPHITVREEVIEDALSAVGTLKSNPKVNAKQLFIVGHSLGAQLAPDIALESGSVRGLVLLAPPARPLQQILIEQLQYLNTPAPELERIKKEIKQLETDSSAQALGVGAAYWKDLEKRNGIAAAQKLKAPLLIMRGERDYQVTQKDIDLWKQGLAQQSNVDFVSIPEANHLLIQGKGKPGPEEYGVPGKVDEGVLDRIAAFIKKISNTP